VRGFRALEVLASELRGRIALAGPKSGHGSAYNWFRSAVDRQTRASMLLPPAVLTPMNVRLGEFYLATAKPADAVEAYRAALKDFPNDKTVLKGLVAALKQAGLKNEAAEAAKQLAAP
jgi:predicted Zn-dependent protease